MATHASMYTLGRKFCKNCGPPESMGEWKPPEKVRDGHCLDCGCAVRNSPKQSFYKARVRGYEGKYSAIRVVAAG